MIACNCAGIAGFDTRVKFVLCHFGYQGVRTTFLDNENKT